MYYHSLFDIVKKGGDVIMVKNTKTEIIETAFDLFKEKGYDNVTINEICQKCEITKTTFYRYLNSKEDCLTYSFSTLNDELGKLVVNLAAESNRINQIIMVFSLIIDKMYYFGKDLYAQLYISNLKKYNGTFDEIPSLKELVTILLDKAKNEGKIKNKEESSLIYESISTLLFGTGIKWCLGLIDDPKDHFLKSLNQIFVV